MIGNVNTASPTPTYVSLDFTWSPSSQYTFTSPDGRKIQALAATADAPVTFSATATITNQNDDISGPLTIVEYLWNFGDGLVGYGNPAVHTFTLLNFQTQTSLCVTDSKGRRWYCRKQMYLGLIGSASLPLLLNRFAVITPGITGSASLPLLLNAAP